MGNCQAAEANMLIIQHPSGRMERFYWSMTAKEVMSGNPGHYVAVIVTAPTSDSSTSSSGSTVQLLKLLSPDDTLLVNRFYYLVTFEDVLKVFGAKRCVKLSKLLARQERARKRSKHQEAEKGITTTTNTSSETVDESETVEEDQAFDLQNASQRMPKCGQWKPTLNSIAEVGN